ncbi:MAG: hypothetical protein HZA82_07430 [Thaumarchaeota archaeon]|nr:hypothetical protein [Nitrososphaerota archaeon]
MADDKPIADRISEMKEGEWREFEFAEHQLGVVDIKANNVLMVDSVLIVISTLAILFESNVNLIVKALSTTGTIFVLISVIFCLKTIWIKWADKQQTVAEVRIIRNKKTFALNMSIKLLFIALALYVAMFIVDFVVNPLI